MHVHVHTERNVQYVQRNVNENKVTFTDLAF